MKNLLLLFLSLFLFWALPVFAQQDAPPDPLLSQQMSLSSAVRSALLNSKQSMTDLENSYKSMMDILQNKVDVQSKELTRLSTDLTNTMLSFRNLSAELENLNLQLELEKQKVKLRNKILFWFGLAGVVIVLCKVVAFILYAKRVPIPRWLDILL